MQASVQIPSNYLKNSDLHAAQTHQSSLLDNKGTNRSFDIWHREKRNRYMVINQVEELEREAENRIDFKNSWHLNKAAAALQVCGLNFLASKQDNHYRYLHSFHCKKKYCPRCANKKRGILLAKYAEFFTGKAGKEIMKDYDMALLTLTLRHNANTRQGWYFKELKEHFYNLLKYGAFKKFLKGGIYNTEITYTEGTGYHIHRHALVLIPKAFKFRNGIVGRWIGKKFKWKDQTIPNEIRKAWYKKTGDSFMIDLKPINDNDLTGNLLEVFKYIGKPQKNKDGNKVIPAKIIEQLEIHNREKFSNRFGILHKIKSLAINFKDPDAPAMEETKEVKGLVLLQWEKTGPKKLKLVEQSTPKDVDDWTEYLQGLSQGASINKQHALQELQNKSFLRYYKSSGNLLHSAPDELPVRLPF